MGSIAAQGAHRELFSTIIQVEHAQEKLAKPTKEDSNVKVIDQVSSQQASSSDRFAWAVNKAKSENSATSVFSFLFSGDGYGIRSDYFSIRLQGCPDIKAVFNGLLATERVNSRRKRNPSTLMIDTGTALINATEQAVAIVQWSSLTAGASGADRAAYLVRLSRELTCRLNAPWLCTQPVARKRVALVRGRPDLITGGPVYRAAESLGIDLVIVDDEGHWLQPETPENQRHREAFLPTDMTEDAGVASRIIKSLQTYPLPIHGIFTLSDNFFVVVAQVATALNLPTSPVSAFEVSVDKHRSRLLQDSPGHTARVNSVDEMLALMTDQQSSGHFLPAFPMIVKPTKGWSSECVSKVRSMEDLVVAVQRATSRHGGSAVVEPFFEGPEIDVNFVLLDGEVLFCEIADEQPSDADAQDATVNDTFSAEGLILPSALPLEEQEIAKKTLHRILVDLGFRTGVFHVEARMVDSQCEYRRLEQGITDLVPKPADQTPKKQATCRLLEINARPPAYRVTLSTRHTYGVDFFAAHILASVGDYERMALVAVPFNFGFGKRVSNRSNFQCWSHLVYLSAPAEGVVESDAPCQEVQTRRPDLARHVVLSNDYYKKGDKVALLANGARTCIGHVLVSSRKGRRDVIRLAEEIRQQLKLKVAPASSKE
ncbi:hypothetical protein HIM_00735 [Hirsutella minnesotensis 3608]|nr:hypothetical protein HIM_00735 [Hirsutella minnesotensis 3608]